MEKKSIWNVLDSLLPSAVSVYGKIREKETGYDPIASLRNPEQSSEDSFDNSVSPTVNVNLTKKNKTILYVVAGLLVVGAGTYFILKRKK